MLCGFTSRAKRLPRACSACGEAALDPPSATSSTKYCSKPAGEMISRIRAGSSPAFQNVCHWCRGLKTRSPGRPPVRGRRAGRQRALPERSCTRLRVRVDAAEHPTHAPTSGVRRARTHRPTRHPRSSDARRCSQGNLLCRLLGARLSVLQYPCCLVLLK